jgi:hypothetical protein
MTQTTGELFLAHSATKLQQMTAHIEACVLKLDPAQIWNRGSEAQNSIGNLMLHLTGNVRQWIGWSIGGQPDIRRRDEEFASGSNPDDVLAKLKSTVGDALAILKNLPADRLTQSVPTQDGERTALEVIYQVVGHFQQHTGQIIFATKLLTGEDLKFYTPPKKTS